MTPSEPRLRIGLDQRLAAYRTGGISRYALELGNALSAVPNLELTRIRHKRDNAASPQDIRLRTPPHHRFETVGIGIELALNRVALDVYHATDFVAPRFARCPVVATIHDLAVIRWPDQLSRDALRYYRQVERQHRRVAHWITPSNWTKSELCDLVGVDDSDVTVIAHGVSSFITSGDILPHADRESFIVAVGTVEPRKRYNLLLDAFERLTPRPRLVVVGEAGWNTGDLQQRLRSTDGVTWLDRASDADIDRLLSKATALAIPSLAEGFGLGALEAMARGTPVVSSGLGALSEVTGDVAIVPDRDDPESWASALETIIHDEHLWQECSDAGVLRADGFSWLKAARQTTAVYRNVTG